MTVKNVINETYALLQRIGAVNSKNEFYKDWLNRSESYMRVLAFNNKQPSTSTLAICSSKLKYYANLLNKKDDISSKEVAVEFERLSEEIDDIIYQQSKNEWTSKMILESKREDRIGVLA